MSCFWLCFMSSGMILTDRSSGMWVSGYEKCYNKDIKSILIRIRLWCHYNRIKALDNIESSESSLLSLLSESSLSLLSLLSSLSLSLLFTRSARIGETSIHSLIVIKILVIDMDWTHLNEPGRSTVSSIY